MCNTFIDCLYWKRTVFECHSNQAIFYIMFVFGCKINTFCQNFKATTNISLLLFHDYFKFIQSYRILLTNCKHSSFSSLQFERRLNFIIISCIYFLVYFNKKSYLCNRNQTNSHRKIRKTIKKSSLTRGKTWEIKEEYSNLKDNAIWKKQFISPRCMGRVMTTSM